MEKEIQRKNQIKKRIKNKRAIGTEAETAACVWLKGQGYQILARNFRCRSGEIDIIAQEGGYLVFLEVKYRSSQICGAPEEAVDWRKQQIISRTALVFMQRYRYAQTTPVRFDVAAVSGKAPSFAVTLHKNAFFYCG